MTGRALPPEVLRSLHEAFRTEAGEALAVLDAALSPSAGGPAPDGDDPVARVAHTLSTSAYLVAETAIGERAQSLQAVLRSGGDGRTAAEDLARSLRELLLPRQGA